MERVEGENVPWYLGIISIQSLFIGMVTNIVQTEFQVIQMNNREGESLRKIKEEEKRGWFA